MTINYLILILIVQSFLGYMLGKRKAIKIREKQKLHSLPSHYGVYVSLWTSVPALLLLFVWLCCENTVVTNLIIAQLPENMQQIPKGELSLLINEIKILAENMGVIDTSSISSIKMMMVEYYLHLKELGLFVRTVLFFMMALMGCSYSISQIKANTRARNHVERAIQWLMFGCASIAILTTFGIIFSVLFESLQFFKSVPIHEFLFGTVWSPQTAIRVDQVGSSGSFGAVPLFVGTLLIALIALIIAVPLGLMSAIYLSEYAALKTRTVIKPVLEILAGIPTVVYGFFAALTVAPFIRDVGVMLGMQTSSESALAAGLVMGVMIIPLISSLADDVISAVPQAMRDGAYAMGATKSETIKTVIIPAALPGIVAGILLAASRAIGETMIVVMAAGLAANLTINPMEAVTTVTVQIVTLLTGDQEFDSPKTLAAFALGLGLFLVTLILNVISLHIVRKYREQYE